MNGVRVTGQMGGFSPSRRQPPLLALLQRKTIEKPLRLIHVFRNI